MKKAPSDTPIWQLKKRELLLPLSSLITKPIKLDLSNLHYRPHYKTQGCVIRENNIIAPVTNPIKDPIKDTLVPLRTNFNANGSVRWRTSVYLNLFHWPMGKNSGNRNGVCRYVRAKPAYSKAANRHLRAYCPNIYCVNRPYLGIYNDTVFPTLPADIIDIIKLTRLLKNIRFKCNSITKKTI